MSSPTDAPSRPRAAKLFGIATPRATVIVLAVIVLAGIAAWVVTVLTRPDPDRLLNEGLSVSRRDPAAAEQLFRRAIAVADGDSPDAQVGLSECLARQGDWEEAKRLFTQVDPADCRADVLLEFGRTALEAEQIAEVERALEEAGRRKAAESQAALELLLTGYRRWGLQNEFIATCRQLLRLDPERFEVWAELVDALRGMGLDAECLAAASAALGQGPPDEYRREFLFIVVQLQIAKGDAARGTIDLASLRECEGDTFRVRVCATDLLRLEGRLDESLKSAGSLFLERGQQTTARFIRGMVWLDLGEYENAIRDLNYVVAEQPLNSQAQFKLSEAQRAVGNQTAALEHSRIANELVTKRLQINALLKKRTEARMEAGDIAEQLARLYREIGEQQQAAHWARRAASRGAK